ncbi:hypothetical protein BT69DRAFT_1062413 [Atractiella rhizophila]|nr:hypothetical protein BT69DRAFT_1062413 [Atractiella rhizophila]
MLRSRCLQTGKWSRPAKQTTRNDDWCGVLPCANLTPTHLPQLPPCPVIDPPLARLHPLLPVCPSRPHPLHAQRHTRQHARVHPALPPARREVRHRDIQGKCQVARGCHRTASVQRRFSIFEWDWIWLRKRRRYKSGPFAALVALNAQLSPDTHEGNSTRSFVLVHSGE